MGPGLWEEAGAWPGLRSPQGEASGGSGPLPCERCARTRKLRAPPCGPNGWSGAAVAAARSAWCVRQPRPSEPVIIARCGEMERIQVEVEESESEEEPEAPPPVVAAPPQHTDDEESKASSKSSSSSSSAPKKKRRKGKEKKESKRREKEKKIKKKSKKSKKDKKRS